MAGQITYGMTLEMGQATAEAIRKNYDTINQAMTRVDSVLMSNLPLLLRLKNTNVWRLLDGVDENGKTTHRTFNAFAENYFGQSHGAISETMSVAARFFDENTYELKPEYSCYGYTQLVRMKSLSDEEINALGITKDMSAADIKRAVVDHKKAIQAKPSTVDTSEEVTETPKDEELTKTLNEMGIEVPEPENPMSKLQPSTVEAITRDLGTSKWMVTLL